MSMVTAMPVFAEPVPAVARRAPPAKAAGSGVPVGDLHEEEREVALVPGVAPIANHGLKQMSVERSAGSAIGLALIPDHAANREQRQGRDHAVVERRRRPCREIRMPLRPGRGLPSALACSTAF